MPSANPKLEKQASTETVEPIRQVIIVVEHKIRNLEKRKGKLESYRDIVKNGGELNADQKTAVAKYDEVQQTLEITRELYKQVVSIANDAAKQQKKIARKEALERMQQDITKVREVLLIQDTLMNMCAQGVRDDFVNGVNGAVKLSDEDLKYLDDLYNEVMLKHDRQDSDQAFLQQAQKVAEHYVLIVDGKQREVVGTTYSKLKEIITSISQCGYFDQVHEEVAVEEATQALAETQISNAHVPEQEQPQHHVPVTTNEEYNSESHIPTPQQPETILPIPAFPVPVAAIPVVSGATPVPAAIPVVAQTIPPIPQAVDASYYTNAAAFVQTLVQQQKQKDQQAQQQQQQQQQQPPNAQAPRINDVIGPAPNFFFLQESELDQPEVSAASQAPPVVSHIPAPATVVAAAVTLNAPIPTQTFTNQSFAGPPVVPAQVMYPHQPQEISHLPGFGGANPPPPIPMPQTTLHQATLHQATLQFTQQTQNSFQPQQTQTYEEMAHQESLVISQKDDITHHHQENLDKVGNDMSDLNEGIQNNETSDWGQMSDSVNDWSQVEHSPTSNQDQMQNSQPWGDQQRGFRGRGGRRGNSNSYNNRGRGSYQQNGRGSYYRNNSEGGGGNSYQNGYQQRNWSNNGDNNGGTGGYNNSFKRSTLNQPRGGPRNNDRGGMDRNNRGNGTGGNQFRTNNPRGTANRSNYAPRGKPQAQNS